MPSEESMIEDLREIEQELRDNGEYRKANVIDLFIKHCQHCMVHKSDIKQRIDELNAEKEAEIKGLRGYDRSFAKNRYSTKIVELERFLN